MWFLFFKVQLINMNLVLISINSLYWSTQFYSQVDFNICSILQQNYEICSSELQSIILQSIIILTLIFLVFSLCQSQTSSKWVGKTRPTFSCPSFRFIEWLWFIVCSTSPTGRRYPGTDCPPSLSPQLVSVFTGQNHNQRNCQQISQPEPATNNYRTTQIVFCCFSAECPEDWTWWQGWRGMTGWRQDVGWPPDSSHNITSSPC